MNCRNVVWAIAILLLSFFVAEAAAATCTDSDNTVVSATRTASEFEPFNAIDASGAPVTWYYDPFGPSLFTKGQINPPFNGNVNDRCQNAHSIEEGFCAPDGRALQFAIGALDWWCEDGALVGNRCNVEGEKACVSGDLYACHKNYNPPRAPGVSIYGLTEKVEECSNGCSAGACVPQSCTDECSIATSYQCSGSNLQECRIVNGCKKWVTTETCTKGCANAQCKTCTDACTPGTSYCLNGNLKSCYLPPDAQCYSEIGTVCPLGCSNGACISSVCGNNACESGETQANCSKDCTGAALTMTSPGATEDLSDGIQISATVSQAAKYFEFVLTPLNYIYPGYTYPVSRVNATTSISETIPRSGVFSRGFPAIGPYAFKGRACKTKTGSTFSDCGPWSEKTVQVYYAAPNLPGPANGSTVTLGEIQGGRRLQAEFPYPDGIPAQNTLKIHFNLSWQAGEEQFWPVSCSLPGGVSSLYGSCYASTPIPSPPLGISSAKPKWSAAGQMTYLSLGKLTTFMTNFSPENNFNFKGAPKPRPPTLDGTTSQKEFCDTWWDACKSNLTSPNCKNLKISERCKNTG